MTNGLLRGELTLRLYKTYIETFLMVAVLIMILRDESYNSQVTSKTRSKEYHASMHVYCKLIHMKSLFSSASVYSIFTQEINLQAVYKEKRICATALTLTLKTIQKLTVIFP